MISSSLSSPGAPNIPGQRASRKLNSCECQTVWWDLRLSPKDGEIGANFTLFHHGPNMVQQWICLYAHWVKEKQQLGHDIEESFYSGKQQIMVNHLDLQVPVCVRHTYSYFYLFLIEIPSNHNLWCSFRTAVRAHGGHRWTAWNSPFMSIPLTVCSVSCG